MKFEITWNSRTFEISGQFLTVYHHGRAQARFDLAPEIEGRKANLLAWSQETDTRWTAALSEGGRVAIEIREGHLAYWMETTIPQFERLTYFPGTEFPGRTWQTFLSDSFDGEWEKTLDREVPISSAYDDILSVDGADGAGLTDPGDIPPMFIWNMPVRACALKTETDWLGLSIPGPLPVGVTRFTVHRTRFSITFQVLRPACREGRMPVVYLVPGLTDPYDVLDEDRAISERLNLTVKKPADHPAWWTTPGFKSYLEQSRRYQEKVNSGEKNVDYLSMISRETFAEWIRTVRQDLDVPGMFAMLEQGAYRCYGDYHPTDSMGGIDGFRKMVDDLRKDNIRICYYIHPYMCNRKIDFYREHPEAFCKPKTTGHQTRYACEHGDANPEYALVDWTHPIGRDYILGQVEMIVSDRPGCLNCDWLRSNHWRSPDPRVYDFHDPDWGIGDLMSMKVQKLLYEKAKSIKPHCCVSKAGLGAPYMQPYADVSLLAEEWNGSTDSWYRRGRLATRLLRDTLFLTDPYFLTITKTYEYYMAMAVWCIMEDPIVRHAIHPYMYFRELRDKDYRRRKAGAQVQRNAPLHITDRCHVDVQNREVTVWRKRTQGPLTGWYASLAFGKRCFTTYSETQARVAASETRLIELPLPPKAVVQSVKVVRHDGTVAPWESEPCLTPDGPGLRLYIQDCGGDPMFYQIGYKINGEQP